jgi:hypothetical protein
VQLLLLAGQALAAVAFGCCLCLVVLPAQCLVLQSLAGLLL